MITLKQRPTFEISESKERGYLVLVIWPEGSEQQVDGFASVEAARAWIENDGPSWIADSPYSHVKPLLDWREHLVSAEGETPS